MRVLKFGGTSVANAERFLRVADILKAMPGRGRWPPSSLPRQNHQPPGGDD